MGEDCPCEQTGGGVTVVNRVNGALIRSDRIFAQMVYDLVTRICDTLSAGIAKGIFFPCFKPFESESFIKCGGKRYVEKVRDDVIICEDDRSEFWEAVEGIHVYLRARIARLELLGNEGRIAELKQSFVTASLLKKGINEETIDWENIDERFSSLVNSLGFARCFNSCGREREINCMDLVGAISAYMEELVSEYRQFEQEKVASVQKLENLDGEISDVERGLKARQYYYQMIKDASDYNSAKAFYDEMVKNEHVKSIPFKVFKELTFKCGNTAQRNGVIELIKIAPVNPDCVAFSALLHQAHSLSEAVCILKCMIEKGLDPNEDNCLDLIESKCFGIGDRIALLDILPNIFGDRGQAFISKLRDFSPKERRENSPS